MDIARLQLTLGRRPEAEQSFKHLASFLKYRSVYGIFLADEGPAGEAVAEFTRVLKENPEDRAARTRLIAAYRMANRMAEADKILQTALKKIQRTPTLSCNGSRSRSRTNSWKPRKRT